MSKLLEEAIRKASALPPERQDHYAAVLLERIDQDEQWEATLHSPESLDLLDEWGAEPVAASVQPAGPPAPRRRASCRGC
jgi:hypothetical protein